MKRLTLLTIFAGSLSFCSHAQITKGSVLLGGGIGAYKSKTGDVPDQNNYHAWALYPAAGLAVKENTVVGLRLSYARSKSETKSPNDYSLQEQNGRGAGLFYRRYMPLGKRFYLFGDGAAYYSYTKNKNSLSTSATVQTYNNIGVTLYPGVSFAVSKKMHLEIGLNNLVDLSYGHTKTVYTANNTTTTATGNGFGFTTNVSTSAPLSVGFRLVLGK